MNQFSRAALLFFCFRSIRKFAKTGKIGKPILRVEKILMKDFAVNESISYDQKVYSRKLILSLETVFSERTFLADFRLLSSIIQTRGRLRWLCLQLLPRTFGDSYSMSRRSLSAKIFENWSTFRRGVLGKLELSEKVSENCVTISSYQYTHPEATQKILQNHNYLLENGFAIPHKFRVKKSLKSLAPNDASNLLIFKLILRDTFSVKRFLQYRNHLLSLPKVIQVLEIFPDLQSELAIERQLFVEFFDSSSLTFDERFEKSHMESDVLDNVQVWYQRFIVKDGRWIIIDSTCSPEQDFVAGHWQFFEQTEVNRNSIFLRQPTNPVHLNLSEAIYLIGRCDENWYHFLMDTLPRYLFLEEIDVAVPILIRSDLPRSTIDFVKRLLPNPLILLDAEVVVEISRLRFVSARSTTYDTIPISKLPQVKFSPNVIAMTRNLILTSTEVSSIQESPKRIYLPRESKYRNLLNGVRIFNTLETAGFEKIIVDDDFFAFQHSYFRNAEIVASPGGAILANTIFMSPNSRLIVFRSSRDFKQKLWSKLSIAAKVNLTQFFGIPIYFGRDKLKRQHSDFFCSNIILKFYLFFREK